MEDDVPIDKAVRDLLADIRESNGLWYTKGHADAIAGRMENGVRVITYTFDAKEPAYDYRSEAAQVAALSREQRDAVAHVFGEIAKVANLKFRPVWHVDKIAKADIRLFQGKCLGPDFSGPGEGGGLCNNDGHIKTVILNTAPAEHYDFGRGGYGTIAHELLHALGLSHPGGNGRNPAYTQASTMMSYNHGRSVVGIGPLDVAALQYLYGKPVRQPVGRAVTVRDLQKSTVIYSESPIALKIESIGRLDIMMIPLNVNEFGESVSIGGSFEDTTTGGLIPIHVGLAPGTRIKDVLSTPKSMVELHITGNSLPNILQGGAKDDVLSPRGGNDVLTGNGGKNRFILGPHSGRNNRVTDFNPLEDRLYISGPNRPELRLSSDGRETEVLIRENGDTVIASIVLANECRFVTPEQVRVEIEKCEPGSIYNQTLGHSATPPKVGSALPMAARKHARHR